MVGSTSTLVSERIEDAGLSAPAAAGGLAAGGLAFGYPDPDLSHHHRRATIAPPSAWRAGLLCAAARWRARRSRPSASRCSRPAPDSPAATPAEIVSTDLKMYDAGGLRFAIAQAEVTDLVQLDEHQETLDQALIALRDQRGPGFRHADGHRRGGRLQPPAARPTSRQPSATCPTRASRMARCLAQGVVSRKKQLLPVVLGLLER